MAKTARPTAAALLLAAIVCSLARSPFTNFVGGRAAAPRAAARAAYSDVVADKAVEDLQLALERTSADAPEAELLLASLFSDLSVRESGYDFADVYEDKTVANRVRKGKRATLTKVIKKFKTYIEKVEKKYSKNQRR